MCLKHCFKTNFEVKKESSQKVYKKIICNTCNNSCYTDHLYLNYLGVHGFCNKCWEEINNFKLDDL